MIGADAQELIGNDQLVPLFLVRNWWKGHKKKETNKHNNNNEEGEKEKRRIERSEDEEVWGSGLKEWSEEKDGQVTDKRGRRVHFGIDN